MQQNKSLRRSSSDHSVDAARSLMRSGARQWQISIDIISGAHAQQQTSRTPLLLSIGGTDRQTIRRTCTYSLCCQIINIQTTSFPVRFRCLVTLCLRLHHFWRSTNFFMRAFLYFVRNTDIHRITNQPVPPLSSISNGPITIAIRARFEYDSSAIQHPTRSYVLSSNNEHVNSFPLL